MSAPQASESDQACEHVLAHLLRLEPLRPLTEARFQEMCGTARQKMPAVVHRTGELLRQIRAAAAEIRNSGLGYPGMEADLTRLLPPDLLLQTPHARLHHVLRYLKAVRIRADRARNAPAKDTEKAARIAEFDDWENEVSEANREAFRWMLEEFRVSVFAQELGTAEPVSVKRLEALLG